MKKTISLITLIFVILSILSGCYEDPKYRPDYHDKDQESVWVCKKPFAYFYVKTIHYYGYPYNYPTGQCINNGQKISFCLFEELYKPNSVRLMEANSIFNAKEANDAEELFYGDMQYHNGYMEYSIKSDYKNFFVGRLPIMKFDKTTKYAFLKEYGNLKYQRELPELKSESYGKPESKFLGIF